MIVIPFAEKYSINADGTQVINNKRQRALKIQCNNGYQMVNIELNNGKRKWQYIHRIIAQMFIPNPDHKPEVNHKDGNKANNTISNLEWSTKSENHLHAHRTGLKKYYDRTGANHSEATKKKQSAAKIGEKHPKFKGYYVTPYGKFASANLAQKEIYNSFGVKIGRKTILNRCKKNTDGFYFKPI